MQFKQLLFALALAALVACQPIEQTQPPAPSVKPLLSVPLAKVIENPQPDNSAWAQQQPYVLMISLDGFRWDYVDMYKPKFLSRFVAESARLEGLRPSYPSKTFPNHITLVTGLYPQNHGIVANDFYESELQKRYRLKDREAVRDGRFYKGLSIWGLAAGQGMR
ncbi:MAG: alkaline phosphatase family protein, partial [Cellvibrionaceae bacterium]|nr:alkaline phosphatase family protein [Cellvibrionaceae bacterium]